LRRLSEVTSGNISLDFAYFDEQRLLLRYRERLHQLGQLRCLSEVTSGNISLDFAYFDEQRLRRRPSAKGWLWCRLACFSSLEIRLIIIS
jgi:hypothetical protein